MNVTGTAAGLFKPVTGSASAAESSPGGFLLPNSPNIVDFLSFLNESVQIPSAALPATSVWPGYAFNQAMLLVLPAPLGILYTLAVYNCATHLLFMMTPDLPGQNYFTNARSNSGYGIIQPSTGIIVSSFDQGTGASMTAPKWAAQMTVSQLGFFRTPWGREYLSWQQSYGPTIVGLS